MRAVVVRAPDGIEAASDLAVDRSGVPLFVPCLNALAPLGAAISYNIVAPAIDDCYPPMARRLPTILFKEIP